MLNKRELDFTGVLKWRKKGYTGKGVKIANVESTNPRLPFFHGRVFDPLGIGFDEYKNSHGTNTSQVIHQVAPDADIYILPSGGEFGRDYARGRLIEETIPFLEQEGIHLFNASLGGVCNKILSDRITVAQQNGVTFNTSAGNSDERGVGGFARSGVFIVNGAVHLSAGGDILHANYSSIGEEVDFTQFSGVEVYDARTGMHDTTITVYGTSFSSPWQTAMQALVQQFFLEKAGRTLYQWELYEFMKDYSVDLWEPGKDVKSGYGIFLLPDDPDSIINIGKYVTREVIEINEPKYIVMHHSATDVGDVDTFRAAHKRQGWRDVGYHYVIKTDGTVQKGRDESESGAHAKDDGMNYKSIGVCLVGDFTKYSPTPQQIVSATALVQDVMKRHSIPAANVIGHNEVKGAATLCPGKCFDMNKFREGLSVAVKTDWDNHEHRWGIGTVISKGIMVGDKADGSKFRPDDNITRAEFATAIAKMFEKGYVK